MSAAPVDVGEEVSARARGACAMNDYFFVAVQL
jgi:hypothetical protein